MSYIVSHWLLELPRVIFVMIGFETFVIVIFSPSLEMTEKEEISLTYIKDVLKTCSLSTRCKACL